jgi:phospholipid N-methyltransferase
MKAEDGTADPARLRELRAARGTDDIEERARFLSAFLRSPITTGAIAPSSEALAQSMLEGLDLARANTIVEVGPGTGSFTAAILQAAAPGALVMGIEINPDFASRLARRHPRLRMVNDSVERLPEHLSSCGRAHADAILCGVPWAILNRETQRRLLQGICRALRPGGGFATFGYVHCRVLPWSRHFRRLLHSGFDEVRTSRVVWRNLPPAFVYRCRR